MTTKSKHTAEAAYEVAHSTAVDLLRTIRDRLQDMPAPGCDDHPIHWGHVGDINDIVSRLAAIRDAMPR